MRSGFVFEDFIFMLCDLWACVSVLILVMVNLYTFLFYDMCYESRGSSFDIARWRPRVDREASGSGWRGKMQRNFQAWWQRNWWQSIVILEGKREIV